MMIGGWADDDNRDGGAGIKLKLNVVVFGNGRGVFCGGRGKSREEREEFL